MASIAPSLSLRSPRSMVLMLLIMATALATKRSPGNTKVNNKMITMPTLDMALPLLIPARQLHLGHTLPIHVTRLL